METFLVEKISNLDYNRTKRLNQRFIQESIADWDKYGEGCYAEFITYRFNEKWFLQIASN